MRSEGAAAAADDRGALTVQRGNDGTLVVRLAGNWRLQAGVPSVEEVQRALASAPRPTRLAFDAATLGEWDSSLVTVAVMIAEEAAKRKVPVDDAALPSGLKRLLALAAAVPDKKAGRGPAGRPPLLARIGVAMLAARDGTRDMLAFLGEATLSVGRLARGRARFRGSDFALYLQQAGAEALPIVTLISFLVGAIFAFVGAVQLEKFGAAIYVADLVGIAMVREMAAVMTAIVMAGRTGAAYAAQLGTMKVTQEVDALTTMGILPMDFLVLPRMLALSLMMPLLCLYSDAVGILGGAAVGTGMLKLGAYTYFHETFQAVDLVDLAGGVFKASVYGVLVALAGCLRGLQSGKSSSAVGEAATAAVVTGIVAIITACGIFAVVFYLLDI